MPRFLIERRLRGVTSRLRRLRADLAVTDEQLTQFADDADYDSIRALVSDDPTAAGEGSESRKHLVAMRRHRDRVTAEIASLEARQDELLDWLGAQ